MAFGQASIFAQVGAAAEHQGDKAIDAIELIMMDHGLDLVLPGLTKVTFVNGTYIKGVDTSIVGELPGNQSTAPDASGGGLPGYTVALIIVVVVGLFAVLAFFVIRKKHQRYKERREASSRLGALAFEELSLAGRSRDDL